MSARVVLVAAVAENGVIGRRDELPWRLPKDLAFFRRTTLDGTLVVGRRTFTSMGGPLDRRDHIVLSRAFTRPVPTSERIVFVGSYAGALRIAEERGLSRVFVIGGAEVFREALPGADEFLLTRVLASVAGDAFFPEWEPDDFERSELERHPADLANDFPIVIERWLRKR